jgi:hypothetical protein
VKFPPIAVFFDGEKHWLADGFHHSHATVAAGLSTTLADVRPGTRRDALLHSLAANADHGHRRTSDDKRRAVDIVLADPEWARWSDSEIARRCAVAPNTVGNRRRELSSQNARIAPRLVSRGSTTYPMQMPARNDADDEPALLFPLNSPPPDAPPAPTARLRRRSIDWRGLSTPIRPGNMSSDLPLEIPGIRTLQT